MKVIIVNQQPHCCISRVLFLCHQCTNKLHKKNQKSVEKKRSFVSGNQTYFFLPNFLWLLLLWFAGRHIVKLLHPNKKINNNQLKTSSVFLFSLFPSFDHPCFFLNVVGWGLLDIGCFSPFFFLSFFDGGKLRN